MRIVIINHSSLRTILLLVLPAQAAYHEPLVSAWFEIVSTDYKDSQYISSSDAVTEADARAKAL